MNKFEFWQKWGKKLDDKQFANSFMVLGIFESDALSKKRYKSPGSLQDIVREIIRYSMGINNKNKWKPKEKDYFLHWRFPEKNSTVRIGRDDVFLADLDPLSVSNAWGSLINEPDLVLQIKILDFPIKEMVSPWFRLFQNASPSIKAVHIDLNTDKVLPQVKWPLRLGYFPGNKAEKDVRNAFFYWPSSELTQIVCIDRENDNCDLLIFNGNTTQLLKMMLDSPVPHKTNLIIIHGSFEDDLKPLYNRLFNIIAESHANGFVIVNPNVKDESMARAINRLVENLSHNQPLDVAIFEAFTKSYHCDPVICLSKDLASFQIEHLLEKMYKRLESLPKGAHLEMKSDSFERMGIPTKEIGKDDFIRPDFAAKKLREFKKAIIFEREDTGATGMAKMGKAIETSECESIDKKQIKRFLQKQVYITKDGKLVEEERAFFKGISTIIRIRIGQPDKKWGSLGTEFSTEKLPKDRDEWCLSVVLSEPDHIDKPLRKPIKLPKNGPSTECEFQIIPGKKPVFEGRITVIHRGRILQTALLKGRVVKDSEKLNENDVISFDDILSVRSNIVDLGERRQFDLALVHNRTSHNRSWITAISANHEWVADIPDSNEIIGDLNTELSNIAMSPRDYHGGLEIKENVQMLVKLAQIGRSLYGLIVEDYIKNSGNETSFEKVEYIQVVSTQADDLIPLEFIYNAVAPNNDAKLCPPMETLQKIPEKGKRLAEINKLIDGTCLEVGNCSKKCKYQTVKYVCPIGFWGVTKVIERHMTPKQLKQSESGHYLQTEPTTLRGFLDLEGSALVAASTKVKKARFEQVIQSCTSHLGLPPQEVKNWDQWKDTVKTIKPRILLALPHTEGSKSDASLEIGGKSILSGQITPDYVHPEDEPTFPLVALIGCDTAGTSLDYGSYVSWFRRGGAALVISTIAKVFVDHATDVAEQLIEGLISETDKYERIGEIIRAIKQKAIIEGPLMALCIVAFGDADWKLTTK
ncbi:MAG: hypothetical protein MUO72_02700 [Bacteroidales bacterium]|nr:hypothetical protein [Bacteroidales bacterium]